MTNLLLDAHTLRHSLTFRTLKTEPSGHVDLLGDNNTLGEKMSAYKQPAGKKNNSGHFVRYVSANSTT